jgi:transcription initiation factor IIE alpha subunit
VNQFISGAQCQRVSLDQEMDSQIDCVRCKEGKERYDICQNSDAIIEEAEALQQAYQAKEDKQENRRCRLRLTLGSRIDIPSSCSVV